MLAKIVAAKKITAGEARGVATAVARDACAAALRRLRRELAAVIGSAERAMLAAGTERLVAVRGGIGIPVPSEHMLRGEGVRVSDRTARWMVVQRTVMLPEWSVADWRLTRCGVGAIDRWRNQQRQRPVSEIADDIRAVLQRRAAETAAALAKLPRGATVADAVRLWPGLRGEIERLVR